MTAFTSGMVRSLDGSLSFHQGKNNLAKQWAKTGAISFTLLANKTSSVRQEAFSSLGNVSVVLWQILRRVPRPPWHVFNLRRIVLEGCKAASEWIWADHNRQATQTSCCQTLNQRYSNLYLGAMASGSIQRGRICITMPIRR
eukprot:scaffold290607_cov17-Prasinocladus_malaysianus.AAC.1